MLTIPQGSKKKQGGHKHTLAAELAFHIPSPAISLLRAAATPQHIPLTTVTSTQRLLQASLFCRFSLVLFSFFAMLADVPHFVLFGPAGFNRQSFGLIRYTGRSPQPLVTRCPQFSIGLQRINMISSSLEGEAEDQRARWASSSHRVVDMLIIPVRGT